MAETLEYVQPLGEWDYVVVGGGSAGCVVAKRLAEDPKSTVLLLDAGRESRSLALRVPGAILSLRNNPRFERLYTSLPDASRDGQLISWNAGTVLGGGSAINGMVFNRGLARDYDSWRDSGCTGWAASDVLPFFERLEHFEAAASPRRGTQGPVGVEFNRYRPEVLDQYLQACREAGIPVVDDINAFPLEGMGQAQASTWRGVRQTTANTYLRSRSRNLRILTAARVDKLIFEDHRCSAIRLLHGRVQLSVRPRRAVVLCAGTFGSPQILLRSGIGPPDLLHGHGIAPVLPLEGVGRNLQEHTGVGLSLPVKLPTITVKDQRLPRAALHGFRWLLRGKGAAAGAAMIACGYARSDDGLAHADLSIQLGAFAFDPHAEGEMRFTQVSAITSFVSVARPRQRGYVELSSPDPESPPKIAFALLGDADDRNRLLAGFRLVAAIHAAPALHRIAIPADMTDWTRACDDAIVEHIAKHAGPQYHPVGTCRMGIDEQAVVDPTLRVRGIANLYVADASIMPQITSANTNAPVMMIGERAAEFIKRAEH